MLIVLFSDRETNNEGGKLKETGYIHWNYYSDEISDETTNESGFNALPGGYVVEDGYINLGSSAVFWTSTKYNESLAYFRMLFSYQSSIWRHPGYEKLHGHSVRCLKD